MAEINKIKVNENEYDIVPQLGTALSTENGVVNIDLGSGIFFDENGKIAINLGTGVLCDDENGKLAVCFGTAQVAGNNGCDCGIAINENGFVIEPVAFKSYLISLGVQFN